MKQIACGLIAFGLFAALAPEANAAACAAGPIARDASGRAARSSLTAPMRTPSTGARFTPRRVAFGAQACVSAGRARS